MKRNKNAAARIGWTIHSKRVFSELKKIFGNDPVELIEFGKDEELWKEAFEGYALLNRDSRLVNQKFPNIKGVVPMVRNLLTSAFKSEEFLFFMQQCDIRGVYRTTRAALQAHALDVLDYDGNCVTFVSPDGAEGFLLDYEAEESVSGLEQYEVEYWLDKRSIAKVR